MEEQIPPSQAPVSRPQDMTSSLEAQMTLEGQITPEQLAQMKARARELAIQQTMAQQAFSAQQPPQIVYLRRNFTVAELLLVILLSCGIVTGVQWTWNFVSTNLPRIEIKMR